MFHWLQRKPKNRRFAEREELLDVRLRAGQTRAARFRIAGIGLGVVFALGVIGLVLWRGEQWLLDSLIYKNDAFAIREIDVQTDGVLTAEAIRRWAMVRTGENLMALDLMRVKRDLELQPFIQSVAVERVLPHTLRLQVTEREPIAQTIVTAAGRGGKLEQAVYDFDEDGYTMKPLDPRWRTAPPPVNQRLPILVGVQAADVLPGRPAEAPQIRAALRLLCEFDHSPMTGLVELERINLTVPEVLQVTTTQGAEISFSFNNFATQLRRWRLIYDQYQKWGKAIAWLDLSISNNLPVRWVAAASLPPVPPHALKPSRPKRKHV
ncbi:MAG: FtsQ-type POTRA domain-containing protein [Verrucomicrobiota bacterium]|jgi:cell division protein FtsQ